MSSLGVIVPVGLFGLMTEGSRIRRRRDHRLDVMFAVCGQWHGINLRTHLLARVRALQVARSSNHQRLVRTYIRVESQIERSSGTREDKGIPSASGCTVAEDLYRLTTFFVVVTSAHAGCRGNRFHRALACPRGFSFELMMTASFGRDHPLTHVIAALPTAPACLLRDREAPGKRRSRCRGRPKNTHERPARYAVSTIVEFSEIHRGLTSCDFDGFNIYA